MDGTRGKIVHIITRLNIGGAAQHVIGLAAELRRERVTNLMVVGRTGSDEGDMLDLAREHGLEPILIQTLSNRKNLLADVRALIALVRILKREKPTLVDLHLLKARTLGAMAARLTGVPVLVETLHGTLFTGYFHPLLARLLVLVERWLARFMHVIFVVGEAVAGEVVRLGVAPERKLRKFTYQLGYARFAGRSRGRLRRELGLQDGTPVVGTISRLVPVKGLENLIRAAGTIIRSVRGTTLVIIGDGPHRAILQRLAKDEGVSRDVHFLGWRRDVESIYPDLDIFVLPSLNEGIPVAIMEAMAAARPIVATRVGGIPDVIVDRETGLLVSPGQPAAIADAVIELLRAPSERERLGRNAQASVLSRFPASGTDPVVAIYLRLLDASARSRGANTV